MYLFLTLVVLNSFSQPGLNPDTVDVIIITNRGGWGNFPLEKSPDILPVVKGIQDYLLQVGLSSIIINYHRAPVDPFSPGTDCLTRLKTIAEMLDLHHSQARCLVHQIESLAGMNSQLKFILIGISNGALFANQVMELLPAQLAKRTFSIELGPPFWHRQLRGKNNLILDNEGTDPLTTGEVETILASFLGGLGTFFTRWLLGKNSRLEECWHIPYHDYPWEKVQSTVTDFLRRQVITRTAVNP